MTNEVTTKKEEKYAVSYQSGGQKVELSPSVVNQFVTKGNAKITGEEAVNFIKLCQYAQLNPFLNEAYLVKFNGSPAQMITSKEAFMKRAESNPNFKGFKAGIIVEKDGDMVKRDGAIKMKNETIIGAWCEVYRDDRDVPTYVEIAYDEFSKSQATWKQQPANMIRKVAVVNALREAFPNSLGAMYTEDDKSPQEVIRQAERIEEDDTTTDLLSDFQNKQEPDDIIEGFATEVGQENEVQEHEQSELFEERTTQPKQ